MASHKLSAALLALLLAVAATAQARVYLVAAGIADYPGNNNDLLLPAADARTIARLYNKNSDAEIMLLLDANATAANITAAIGQVLGKAGKGDIAVFFFSGHGVKGGFVAYDKVLTYSQVRNAMARCKSDNKMIFADACFSGKIRTTDDRQNDQVEAAGKANVMLFLSSRNNETSIERRGMKNGFFTTYLQRALRGGADSNRDRTITARELYDYVHGGVAKISGGRQHPVMWGNFPDTMPVMVW